jgi:hypothetical protein
MNRWLLPSGAAYHRWLFSSSMSAAAATRCRGVDRIVGCGVVFADAVLATVVDAGGEGGTVAGVGRVRSSRVRPSNRSISPMSRDRSQ